MAELETGVNFFSVKQDEQIQQQEALTADNNALRKQLSTLEQKLHIVEDALHRESTKRDEHENVQQKQCLEISGIPKPKESEKESRKGLETRLQCYWST